MSFDLAVAVDLADDPNEAAAASAFEQPGLTSSPPSSPLNTRRAKAITGEVAGLAALSRDSVDEDHHALATEAVEAHDDPHEPLSTGGMSSLTPAHRSVHPPWHLTL